MEFRLSASVLLRRGDEILLTRRQNTGFEDGNFGLIAGHVEPDESATAAAVREAKEEVGIIVREADLKISGVMQRISRITYVDFFFSCDVWTGEIRNVEPEKCSELRWSVASELPSDTIPYVARAVALSGNSMWFEQANK